MFTCSSHMAKIYLLWSWLGWFKIFTHNRTNTLMGDGYDKLNANRAFIDELELINVNVSPVTPSYRSSSLSCSASAIRRETNSRVRERRTPRRSSLTSKCIQEVAPAMNGRIRATESRADVTQLSSLTVIRKCLEKFRRVSLSPAAIQSSTVNNGRIHMLMFIFNGLPILDGDSHLLVCFWLGKMCLKSQVA